MSEPAQIKTADVRFVKELYPRLKPLDDVIERYRDSIANLPPIAVARDAILVDGFHRWQAHVREGVADIQAIDLGNLSDAEIIRESITRNSTHGQQLSRQDKQRLAINLWMTFAAFPISERVQEIVDLLAVSRDAVERWTKDARQAEKEAQQAKAWDLWLDCQSQREIADALGMDQATVSRWIDAIAADAAFASPPASRQHFDLWQFPTADQDDGQQSYFGALPPQVVENLLWFHTEPGETVVDLFAGSGTTIDVAKKMGRRVWASDIRGNHYSPHLPIHQHDVLAGWPTDAPKKADLVILDPPYWRQASGRYSTEPNELAEMSLDGFSAAWAAVVAVLKERAKRVAYLISPSLNEDGSVTDHATAMLQPLWKTGWHVERRIIVPYQTQQSTGAQVTWARENKRMLMLYRDLVVVTR